MLTKTIRLVIYSMTTVLILLSSIAGLAQSSANLTKEMEQKVRETLKENGASIRFMKNAGQLSNPNIRYYYEGAQGSVYIESDRIRFVAKDVETVEKAAEGNSKVTDKESRVKGTHTFSMYFEGGNPMFKTELGDSFSTNYNYFFGENSNEWVHNVNASKEITLKGVFDGIDLRLYSAQNGQIEFDWIVAPNADISKINLRFEGQNNLLVNSDGSMSAVLAFTTVNFNIPESYQVKETGKTPINISFKKKDAKHIGFQTSTPIDSNYPVVIDPILSWGTFFDGNDSNFDQYLFAIQADATTGIIYCAGGTNRQISTSSAPYDADGYLNNITGFGTGATPRVAIVYRISADGSDLMDLTLLGPSDVDGGSNASNTIAYALSLSANRVFIGGRTNENIPMTGSPFDNSRSSSDGFVASFSKDLGTLHYSSYIGGSGNETRGVTSIRALSDNSYVIGATAEGSFGSSYISAGAADNSFSGDRDMYIAKFVSNNSLSWGTYVGGNGDEYCNDVEVFEDGRVAFAGYGDDDLTEVNSAAGRSTSSNNEDAIIGVLNASGTSFLYLDELGGSNDDYMNDIEIIGETLYFTGYAESGFPVSSSGVYDSSHNGGRDAIVGKVSANGGSGQYKCTYYGGSGDEIGNGIKLVTQTSCDGVSNSFLLVFGTTDTNGSGLPTQNLNGESFFDSTNNGGLDMFFAGFKGDVSGPLVFGTYIGGDENDYLGDTGSPRGSNHLWVDGANIYVGTTTHSATHTPAIVGNGGFDTVKTNNSDPTFDDTHVVFAVQFAAILGSDYGDAPSSYGSPAHVINCSTIFIGNDIDSEAGHIASANADGDNNDDTDDEDGISVLPLITTGNNQSFSITVDNVQNTTPNAGVLMGWIDFNSDGAFQSNEYTSIAVPAGYTGPKTLTWSNVNVSGNPGNHYLRIRLTTNSLVDNLGTSNVDERSTAQASNGEVEDYRCSGVTCPNSVELQACSNPTSISNAYTAWLNAYATGGPCGGSFEITVDPMPDACLGGTAYMLLNYSDGCGNTYECASSFSVEGAGTPQVSCPTVYNGTACLTQQEADAAYLAWLALATGNGGCNGVLTHDGGNTAPDVATGGTKTVTFLYSTDCGNATCISTFTIPQSTFECPENITIACGSSINPDVTGAPVTNCGIDEWTYSDSDCSAGIACGSVICRHWTSSQGFECDQTITIIDSVNPTIVSAPDATIEVSCDGPMPTLEVVFADNCDQDLTITDGSSTETLDCGATITRWVTATDDCGNAITFTQTVNVVDETVPYIVSAPEEEIWVECDQDVPALVVEFADNCDADLDLQQISGIAPMDCGYDISRSITATDNCGNAISFGQVVHIRDTSNPTIVSAPDATIEVSCDGPMPTLEVVFADNCDQDLTITDGSSTETLDCGATITRWVTATDDCGNAITFTQTVNVVDETAPYIVSAPEEEIWVECDQDVPALVVEFADNCDADLDIQQISGIAPMDCGYDISRSITATDNCGNAISFSQVVHIRDTTNPTIVSAPDATIEVSCDGPMPTLEVVFADNCDQDLTITDGSSTETLDCGATITRWVTATDDCGNAITFTQTVNVVDETVPYIVSAPEEEIWVECDQDVPALVVEFADNCDADLDLQQISGIAPMDCGYDISRSITATDNCGNAISFGQVVHIRDTTNPTIVSAPAEEIWVECDAEVPALVVEFTDNCDTNLSISEISGIVITECGYDIARSITATDDCGNSITFSQGVHIRDTTAPVIVSQPGDLTILCTDAEPEAIAPIFSDNCAEELEVTSSSSIVDLECGYEIHRTWTATDDCGNQTTATQIITVTDNVPPVIGPFVPYLGMSCTEVDEYIGITATDNCNEVTITWVDQLNSGGCLGTLMRTYYATDACGNQSTAVQYISIHDLVGPVILNPENTTVECDEAPTSIPDIVIYDECGFEVEILEATQTIVEGDGCTYQIIWHWVAMDYCENISEATTIITVTDTTAPVVEDMLQDAYFSCDAEYTAPSAPAATDNCTEELTVTPFVEMIAGDCPQSYSLLYIWEYADNCGNTTTATVTHFFYDETAPVFAQDAVAEVSIECNNEIPYIEPAASDNCGQVTISHEDNVISQSSCYTLIERVFTAVDECGNASEFVQTITIQDLTAPVFNDYMVEIEMPCDNYEGVFVTATDNCSEVEISYTDEQVSGGCQGRIIRTYYAMDACENTSSVQQIITLTDDIAPMAEVAPENITVECGSEIPMFIPSWYDNCDEELELYAASSVAYDNCVEIITRTWTATDNCGNSTTLTQVVTIVDTTAPEWEYIPESFTIECSEELLLPGMAYAWDLCDQDVEVTMVESTEAGNCPNNYTIVRTYTATDYCGNSISASQYITVVDTTAPVFGEFQSQLTVECDAPIPYIAPSASDNCGEVIITYTDNTVESSGCYSLVERVFTATDDCGNEASVSQWISIVDNTAPVFNDYMVEIEMPCDNYEGVFVTATDNCSEVEISYTDEHVSGGCQGRIIRTYYAMDACENTSSVQQIITLTDDTAPMAEVAPENITIECGSEIPMFIPSWYDNCDEELELFAASSVAYDNCVEIITRTWTATDNCSNSTTLTQVVTIVDTTAPEWEYTPESFSIECSDEVPAPEMAYAWDVCDQDVEVTMVESTEAGNCPNNYTIIRTYTATDDCGNSISASQYITVVDTTAPVFGEFQSQLTVECDAPIPYIAPSASDNCGEVIITYTDNTVESSGCYSLVERVFTATDDCGNQASVSQWISIVDNTAPVFNDYMVEIEMPCDNYEGVFVTATDNCSEVEISYTDEHVSGGCQGRIIRTYYAMDACENTSSVQQIITLTDDTAPMAEVAPENITVECGSEIPMFIPSWYDNCDEELELFAASSVAYDNCVEIITRTWTATDNCGNSTTLTQVVTIVDTTAPEWEYVPESFTIECSDEVPAPEMAYAWDLCDQDVEITMVESTEAGNCPNNYTIIRTYTATDDCENTTTYVQTISVFDTTAPVLGDIEAQVTYECDEAIALIEPTVYDACGEVELTHEDTVIESSDCLTLIQRVFTATDACGNSSSAVQMISIVDTTPPVFFDVLNGLQAPCDNYDGIFVSASDNCNEVEITYTDEILEDGCAGIVSRTYTATDACGNSSTVNQFIILTDQVAPVAEVQPENITIECGTEIPMFIPEWMDNCDDALELYAGSSVAYDNCVEIITRTWTATDNCGNSTTLTQVVTIVDTTNPVWEYVPESFTIECSEELPLPGMAYAYDVCDQDVTITMSEEIVEGECANNYTIVRTYTATDDCGNNISATQNIYVVDTTAPVFTYVPDNNSVSCADFNGIPMAMAVDACGDVEVTYTETSEVFSQEGSDGDCGQLTTFSAGGWGAPNGAAANYRDANFAGAFPSGLTVGCDDNTYTFTSALAIENFLPAGGTSNTITGATVNPTGVSNQLANQLVAASLSIGFDAYDPNFGASSAFLGDLTFNNGTFDGMTVAQVVGYANNALGGCPQPYTLQQLASAMEVINLNYDGNGVDQGNFSCESESVCGILYTRTYTATDACGNSAQATTEYIVFDDIAPVFDQEFENVTVECAGDVPAPAVATATDSCSQVEVSTEVVVVESDDCGNQTIHVIYTAIDECGNTASTGYYIYVNDNTDPMFEACPENIVLACDGVVPAAEMLVATDNCDNEVEVIFDEFIIGDVPAEGSVADCNILTPALPEGNSCAYPTSWAMAMFGMPSQYRYYTVENGSFIEYPDGSIHVIAEMHSTNFESTGFDVDVWFNNPMDWSEWSTQGFPTSFKADCGGIAANHEEWMYYILQNGDGAELTGFGDFEGSALNLSHAPSNNYFGFQKGNGANNYNGADNGFGGWFTYNGFFQINEVPYGQNQGSVSGAGDFAFELDCCPDYQIVRQWTAVDCSGNSSTCIQTISFEASDATNNGGNIVEEYTPSKTDELAIGQVSMNPNPAKDNVNFKFKATLNTRVSIDIYDITGKLIGNVFSSEVQRGNEYFTTFDVSYLPNGVYFVKTNNGLKITTEKLVVSK